MSINSEIIHTDAKIIFITGFKGSGKTTVAEMFKPAIPNSEILPFVNIVKSAASHLFNIHLEKFYDAELKDKTLDQWPHETPRNLLLKLADSILITWPDIWIHPWKTFAINLLRQDKTVIVPDLRMMQEWNVTYVARNQWGVDTHTIRVRKKNETPITPATHITERFINDFVYDYEISNDGTLDDLRREVYRVYLCIFKPETITS